MQISKSYYSCNFVNPKGKLEEAAKTSTFCFTNTSYILEISIILILNKLCIMSKNNYNNLYFQSNTFFKETSPLLM